ncbi:uncharacterized protein [Henckelia pumila]|uniref:uncharacterized protein n=1 Tax=Henckelia pumila TaxID=405737 RepID=UPI003C6E79C1
MPSSLRRLFVSILVFCQPTKVRELWDEFHTYMSEDYGRSNSANNHPLPRIIEDELSIQIPDDDLRSIEHLNAQQKMTFDSVIQSIMCNQPKLFFIDGPGGTGKTFLYHTILAHLRKSGKIVIAVATSGIAKTLLPGGRTAHSRL